eukprot:CAMPEP_0119551266 /NCGR_PEP_ID=MMETSP1352-20130426/4555_1 /TAXON_ID=265584 /ORGANISM="Stauroneis constricta, Strain CCMP1120" /LENGTH=385 /DNA_ID=CAMNT_0007597287 /DNA_START=526 /DNA_END=1683 /DNA_ORIENTATION=-
MSGSAARGPLRILLQTASGQWIVLGMGAYGLFPDQVKAVLNPIVLRALEQAPPQVANQLAKLESAVKPSSNSTSTQASAPAPIIIHAPGSYGGRGWTITIVQFAVGAGLCVGGYAVVTNSLPDYCKELLPVTRNFFESTAKTLGQGILNLKQALEEQILGIVESQEELDRKLQENTDTVVDIQSELGEAREDLGALGESLERCESTLQESYGMHTFTTRGVKLLVRCVAGLLPNQDDFMGELNRFIKEGDAYPDDSLQVTKAQRQGGAGSKNNQLPPSTPQPYRRSTSGRYLTPDTTNSRRSSSSTLRRQSSSRIESMDDIQHLADMSTFDAASPSPMPRPLPQNQRSSSFPQAHNNDVGDKNDGRNSRENASYDRYGSFNEVVA